MRILILTVLLFCCPAALACSCVQPESPEAHVEDAEIVVFGRNIEAHLLSGQEQAASVPGIHAPFYGAYAVSTFQMHTPIKGVSKKETLTILYDVAATSCTIIPTVGKSEILFLYKRQGAFFASPCENISYRQAESGVPYLDIFESLAGREIPIVGYAEY